MAGAIIGLLMFVGFPGTVINQINGIDPVDSLKHPAIVAVYEFND